MPPGEVEVDALIQRLNRVSAGARPIDIGADLDTSSGALFDSCCSRGDKGCREGESSEDGVGEHGSDCDGILVEEVVIEAKVFGRLW